MSELTSERVEVANREMVQCHLLSHLFSQSLRGQIALKGGFAMRTAHGSARMTKDIDLAANAQFSTTHVRTVIRKAIAGLRASKLVDRLEVTEPKQTDTTMRWKLMGRIGSTDLHLTIEVSRRDRLLSENIETKAFEPPSEYGLQPILCEAFNASALAASKTACLVSPVREAPRDIYDLFVLIQAEVRPPIELLKKMPREYLEKGLENLWNVFDKMDYRTASIALTPFLPAATAERFDNSLWDEMRLTVHQHVESWLKQAIAEIDASEMAPIHSP